MTPPYVLWPRHVKHRVITRWRSDPASLSSDPQEAGADFQIIPNHPEYVKKG